MAKLAHPNNGRGRVQRQLIRVIEATPGITTDSILEHFTSSSERARSRNKTYRVLISLLEGNLITCKGNKWHIAGTEY